MKEQTLTVFAALVSIPVIVIAILVLAVVLGGGAFFLMRGGKKKGADAGNDWQPQAQPDAWNQQGSAAGWNQQQQNSWGGQGAQQQANPWGAPQQQQANPWGNPNPAQNAGPVSNPWGNANQQQQQWGAQQPGAQQPAQPNNPWGNANPQPINQTQPGGQWGNQGAQNPWEAAPAAAPAGQDAWGAPQPQGSGQQWGSQPGQPQQGPSSFSGVSGQSWGQQQQQPADPWAAQQQQQQPSDPWAAQQQQQQPADPWAAQQQQQGSYNGVQNAWQQPGQPGQPGNFNQGGYGAPAADPNAQFGMDNDRTVLRPGSAPQQYAGNAAGANTVGYVRVEEGKEPGRIYEVRKESLSIGRSRESDIFLEDLAVSRLHASIVNLGNNNYALKDEGSANGTKVNGQLVNKFQTYPLQDGDRIQLGQTVLVFGRK